VRRCTHMKHSANDITHENQAKYVVSLVSRRDALLAKMEALAVERREPISDPEVATFLTITIRSLGAKRVLEVGTNIGYGAIVMARAGAHVTTIEKSHELCEIARGFAKDAGLSSQIDVREGDAIAELEKLSGVFDLAYVDCVKEDYPRYLELLETRARVVVADNVLWRGLVAADEVPESERKRVDALRRFNKAITSPPWSGVILPLGDGVALAVHD
jgi:predicted O-methyltransferase YrrM